MTDEQELITLVRVTRGPAHDRVAVWNRHGLAGELTVEAGDGGFVASRLFCDTGGELPTSVRLFADGVEMMPDVESGEWP